MVQHQDNQVQQNQQVSDLLRHKMSTCEQDDDEAAGRHQDQFTQFTVDSNSVFLTDVPELKQAPDCLWA